MVSGPMSCVKYLLFAFNLLFALSGIGVLSVGAISQYVYNQYNSFVADKLYYVPIALIVLGSIIAVIAFFGCCGAVKENHCMITTFATFLLIIFVAEVVAGVAAYMFRNDIGQIVDQKMRETMKLYESEKNVRDEWDILQYDVHCCGVKGHQDWTDVGIKIPNTCCAGQPASESCNAEHAYTEGCWDTVRGQISDHALYLGIAALAVAFIQLVGVIFACCLARSIQRDYETV